MTPAATSCCLDPRRLRRATRALSFLVWAAVLSMAAPRGEAAPITFKFNGSIPAPPAVLAGAFSAGDPFSVTVTVDSGAADSDASPTRGQYLDSILEFVFESGATTLAMPAGAFVRQTIVSDFFLVDEIQFTAVDFGGFIGPLIDGWRAESSISTSPIWPPPP
ncbi:MAG: hypothetical protein WD673_03860 [Alphaproteobacteria bacterium]